ncbi:MULTISPECIES: hypothetical protein [unclassified Exiguobacterium]|uniref:hypothetical protein n=1 Tax=unclassified Exiguobacterium TaxID=2644629 RepID=UPI001BEA5C82|nr:MULTISPECIES: hypothetical protein [unclassified Exiguobacterium]
MNTIALAKPSDLTAIERLYLACKDDLLARQIFQWDDTYPNRAYFEMCIKDDSVYIMKHGEELLGVVVLDHGSRTNGRRFTGVTTIRSSSIP